MPELNEAVIISAARTPVGKFLGSLKGFSATQLGAIVVRESVKRAGVKPDGPTLNRMASLGGVAAGAAPGRTRKTNGIVCTSPFTWNCVRMASGCFTETPAGPGKAGRNSYEHDRKNPGEGERPERSGAGGSRDRERRLDGHA